MYVGVIPLAGGRGEKRICIPHVCGGDPVSEVVFVPTAKYSPCMWG